MFVATRDTLAMPRGSWTEGTRCFISGSTDGIGLETARLLIGEGARVVTSGRRGAPKIGEVAHVEATFP